MFNTFTAKLRKLADVAVEDFCNLLQWGDSPIDASNRNLLVASACDENGAAAYTTIEPTWILNGYAFRPLLTDGDAGEAGDSMDFTIEREARARGISKVLIVLPADVPHQADEKILRFVERKIPTRRYEYASVPDLRLAESPSAWIN